MKRFAWFAGLAGVLTVIQSLQAIPTKDAPTKEPLYSYSTSLENPQSLSFDAGKGMGVAVNSAKATDVSVNSNKSTGASINSGKGTSSNVAAGLRARTDTPMLSLLMYGPFGARSAAYETKFGYSPEPLNIKFSPPKSNPIETTTPARGPGAPATVPDGGATAALLGIALLGTALMKRQAG